MEEYHGTAANKPPTVYDQLPEGPENEVIRQMSAELMESAGGKLLGLQPKLIGAFGAAAGVLLQHLIFWSGKSTFASGGWIYKKRDEIQEKTGLNHREQEKARKILRGEKAWNGKTVQVVEECRPSRRRPTFYRVDLTAVASIIGTESPHRATELDDPFSLDFEENPESPHGATESPRKATESPHGAASESTYREELPKITLLQRAAEPAFAEPTATEINREEEQEQPDPQPRKDERLSPDADTRRQKTAAWVAAEPPPRPTDAALLEDVCEILEPDTGRWPFVRQLWKVSGYLTPEKMATYLRDNVEDVRRPRMVLDASEAQLRGAVRYAMWQRERRAAS